MKTNPQKEDCFHFAPPSRLRSNMFMYLKDEIPVDVISKPNSVVSISKPS